MINKASLKSIDKLIEASNKIVIVQADNPDGDSLGSALALEQILHDLGKEPHLYCGIDIPTYLHYIPGWDRVENTLPNQFDLSIVVDCSSIGLLESVNKAGLLSKFSARPCLVIDHHDAENTIPFTTDNYNEVAVSTGEIIYEIAKGLNWPLNTSAMERIATSILSDSLGLMTENTSARSIHIVAELVEGGVKLPALEEARRDYMRKSPELLSYKADLLKRVEFHGENKVATITIPWEEIEKYSHLYNPSMLVIDEMRLVEGTDIAIAFKVYGDGKITAKIRANYGVPIAADLAKHFGGGGHIYASGFKIDSKDKKNFNEIKSECIEVALQLIKTNKRNVND